VLMAAAAVHISRATLASILPRAWNVSLDVPTLAVACAATTITGMAFALVPAWLGTKRNLADGLRARNHSSLDRSAARLRRAFVVGQFSVATILVAAAAMVGQSLQRLMDVDPGFRSERLLVTSISLPARYPNADSRNAFYHRLIESLAEEPGIESAGLVSRAPLTSGGTGMEVSATLGPVDSIQGERAHWRTATSSYFRTLGIPLVRGRLFDSRERDVTGGFRPIVVSESLARRLWPDSNDPIDRQVRLANGQTRTVVGVVRDVHQRSLAEGMTPTMYMPTSWTVMGVMSLVVRTAGDPASMTRVVRDAVRRLDSQVPIFDVRTMEDQIDRTTAQLRLNASLLGAFAVIALVLGLVGVGGVVAHGVSTRRSELAVRIALGAPAARVAREVAVDGIRLSVYGLLLGLAGTWAIGRSLSSLLFDVRANDPVVLGGIALALMLVSLLACGLPALRVIRVDPVTVLRGE
jgi:putative ABC transport system permease protein